MCKDTGFEVMTSALYRTPLPSYCWVYEFTA